MITLIAFTIGSLPYVHAAYGSNGVCLNDASGTCVPDLISRADADSTADEYDSLSLLQRHASLITMENPVTVTNAPGSDSVSQSEADIAKKEAAVWKAEQEIFNYESYVWLWEQNWWNDIWQYIGVSEYHMILDKLDPQAHLSVGEMITMEWWPLVMFAVMFLTIFTTLSRRIRNTEVEEGARSCAFTCSFLNFLGFSVVIIDSYQVAQMVGGGITYSGAIIGVFMVGSGLGYLLSWTLLTCFPNSWRSAPRPVLITANSIGLIGAFGYAVMLFAVPADLNLAPAAKLLLLVFRMCSGMSQGMSAIFNRVVVVRLTAAEERVHQSVRYAFFTQFGMGVGPLAAAIAQLFIPAGAPAQVGVQHVCVVSMGAQLISVVCMTLLYPDISGCSDMVALQDGGRDGETEAPPDPHSWTKKRIVCTCVFVISMQSFISSGLESLTSIALEKNYHWSVTDVGLCVAGTYLLAIPVILVFVYVKDSWPPVNWAFLICVVQFLATFFLYPLWFLQSGWFLILSDSIVFPLMTVGTGIFIGQMDMFKFPEGSIFNVNNRTLFSGLLTNGVARMVGPIMARFLFASSGMLGYATQQSTCIALCFCAFVTMYSSFGNPNLGGTEEKAGKKVKS
jgi:hypothetical protein